MIVTLDSACQNVWLWLQEPCRSFVLRNVVCSYCNDCIDLDLCRDPALQARPSFSRHNNRPKDSLATSQHLLCAAAGMHGKHPPACAVLLLG